MEVKKPLAIAALLFAGLAAVYFRDSFSAEMIERHAAESGSTGVLFFILLYAAATVLFVPGAAITLAGGAIYGPVAGTVINLTGATLGALFAFLIARYFASDWAEEKTRGRLKSLKNGIEKEGWKFVAFTRLVPFFPFNLLNYALGLTKIGVLGYIVPTFIFMIPGALAYTWLGYLGREAAKGEKGLVENIIIGIGIFAVLAFIPKLAGFFRQGNMLSVEDLKEGINLGKIALVLDVRTLEEFNGPQGHIIGAVNIPDFILNESTAQIDNFVEKKVAVICRTDRRSAAAARLLAEKGFADVHVVAGGMTEWNNKGYFTERS